MIAPTAAPIVLRPPTLRRLAAAVRETFYGSDTDSTAQRRAVDVHRRLTIATAILLLHCAVAARFLISSVTAGQQNAVQCIISVVAISIPLVVYLFIECPTWIFAAYAVFTPLENLIHLGGGGTLARMLGATSGAMFLFVLILRRKAVPLGLPFFAWLAYMCWMTASMLWAIDPYFSGTVNCVQVIELFALYAIVGSVPLSRRELNIVLIGATLGGTVAGIVAINQYVHGAVHQTGWTRLTVASGENHIDFNHFAASLQMPIALTWAAFMASKAKIKKIIFAGALGIMFLGVVLGASRGAIIGFSAMSLYLMIRTKRYREFLTVLSLAALTSLAFPSVWMRFADPTQGEGSGRLPIWKVGAHSFSASALWGIGVGNFQVAYDRDFLKVYQREFQGWSRESNSQVVCTITELGLIGFALLGTATVVQFRSLRFIVPASPFYPIRIALEAGMLALIAESFFIDIMWYKYLWLGLSLMAATRATALHTASREPVPCAA